MGFKLARSCKVAFFIVCHRPNITEARLAEAMYGVRDASRVQHDCNRLEAAGVIKRHGNPARLRAIVG